jgi:hypothetical protein
MSSRKFYLSLLCALIFSSVSAFAEETAVLPEIPGWKSGELMSVQFDAESGDYGYWQERDYRTPDGLSLKAILTVCNGPKFYNQPPKGVSADDGLIGSGATYEIISIGGLKTLIERHPVLGYSIAVNAFEKKFTLTVESGPWEERTALIDRVGFLLDAIMNE